MTIIDQNQAAVNHPGHFPWCDPEECTQTDSGTTMHSGHFHVVELDGPGLTGGLRNDPTSGALSARALSQDADGRLVELEVDTATSGCDDLVWLTPEEALRFAEAIIRAALDAQSRPQRQAS